MANEPTVTIIGHLTADPDLRFTPAGAAVANFTVASTPRTFNRQTNEWDDGTTLFMRCNIWREPAENVAETLTRGSHVIVNGRLRQREFTDKDGNKRTVIELEVDEIGPSLRYATAKVTKTTGGNRNDRNDRNRNDDRDRNRGGGDPRGNSNSSSYDDEPPY